MGRMKEDWYRQRAVELFQKPRDEKRLDTPAVEVVDHAVPENGTGPSKPGVFREEKPMVSHGTNPGAWVMMWAWIPDPPEDNSGEQARPPAGQGADGPAAVDGNHGADG